MTRYLNPGLPLLSSRLKPLRHTGFHKLDVAESYKSQDLHAVALVVLT